MSLNQSSATSSTLLSPRTPHKRPRSIHRDSFAVFAGAAVNDGAGAKEDENEPQTEQREIWQKIVMTPLICISFVLSLFLVERHHRAERVAQHPQPAQSFWSGSTLRHWLDPEPYQDPKDTTWQATQAGKGEIPHAQQQQWFMKKKHRKMAKLELDEAVEMRRSVAILMLSGAGLGLAGIGWFGSKAYHALMG